MAQDGKKKKVKMSSPKKMIRVSERRRLLNSSVKTRIKNTFKTAVEAVDNNEESAEAISKAFATIDRAASKGIIHKNKAARRKSRLALRLNKALEAAKTKE